MAADPGYLETAFAQHCPCERARARQCRLPGPESQLPDHSFDLLGRPCRDPQSRGGFPHGTRLPDSASSVPSAGTKYLSSIYLYEVPGRPKTRALFSLLVCRHTAKCPFRMGFWQGSTLASTVRSFIRSEISLHSDRIQSAMRKNMNNAERVIVYEKPT